jgi:dTDP-4-dehydrorhamnose reductase
MKLVLTGANGQLGWELRRSLAALGDIAAPDRSQLDLARPEHVAAAVRDLHPAVIVNAAAYTAVDKAEEESGLAMTVNGTAAGVLAEEARRAGTLLVHYSTDYVFDGAKDAPYEEEDPPRALNSYGRSKLAGEIAIRQAGCDHLILRTSWLYAARRQNFLRTMLRLARERDELRVVADQFGAPTWAREVADATGRILQRAIAERGAGSFQSGTFHLASAGTATWHGFAAAILDEALRLSLLQRPPRLTAISTADYPLPAARPRNSRLDCGRVKTRYGVRLPDWREGVARCLAEIKQHEENALAAR